jgi:hypothetical protein
MHVIKLSIAATLALPLLLAVPACGDKNSEESVQEQPKVEKQELATLFVGDKVTLPPPFVGLKLGMTVAEGKAAVPSMGDGGDIESEEYPDVWFKADFDKDADKLTRVYFNLPKAKALELMTAQWGEPKQATAHAQEVLWWFNPEAQLRASISDSFTEGGALVELTHYWPIETFLGDGAELAFQKDAPLLGLSREELEAKYEPWIRKQGDDLDLEYPPLEWGKYWTPVHFTWTDDGKIRRVWFSLGFEPHPAAKDEILALLKNKWGEPKEEDEYGRKILVFSEEPFIKVEDDDLSKEWDVFIEAKRG